MVCAQSLGNDDLREWSAKHLALRPAKNRFRLVVPIDNFAGFEYSSCCWALRAVARDYVGRRTGERERSIYVQLELKGLSNVGLAADAFLERSIRGYSSRQRR